MICDALFCQFINGRGSSLLMLAVYLPTSGKTRVGISYHFTESEVLKSLIESEIF